MTLSIYNIYIIIIKIIKKVMSEHVKVMVRCRPFNQKQDTRFNTVQINQQLHQITVSRSKGLVQQQRKFTFDHIFGMESVQNQVYEQSAFLLVQNVLEGYNGTVFAYGQTGCGKTYTMSGGKSQQSKGIIPRTFNHIVTRTTSDKDKQYLLHCSYIEIYNEDVYDLFQKKTKTRLDVKQAPGKGTFIKDQRLQIVKSVQDMQKLFQFGSRNRAIRETSFNKHSSRSHCIFTVHVQSSEDTEGGNQIFKAGKLNLVDLAGSERQSKLKMAGEGLKETTRINLSLSALGNVISSLVDGKAQHIPYRDSKLTRLLQDSLGGNTRTVMIATISPTQTSYQQTLSTLRYASRTKYIKNKPVINEDPKDTLLRQYAQQIKRLKTMLLQLNAEMSPVENRTNYNSNTDNAQKSEEELKKIMEDKQQKQILRKKLQALQRILAKEEVEEDATEIQKINALKDKLKEQQWRQQQYLIDKEKRQEELLCLETNYKSLNQEVDLLREKFNEVKMKYMQSCEENKDLRAEFETQKEDLLGTIRDQELEISKYKGIVDMVFVERQIDQIINKSKINEEERVWNIVPFLFKENMIIFPEATVNSLGELVRKQKNNRNMFISQNVRNNYPETSRKPSIRGTKQSFGAMSQGSQKKSRSVNNFSQIRSLRQKSILSRNNSKPGNSSKIQQLQAQRQKSRERQRKKLAPVEQRKKMNIDLGKLKMDILSQLSRSRTRKN